MKSRPFRRIFGTRRGLRLFALNAFALFGLISAGIQFYSPVWEPQQSLPYPGWIALGVAVASVAYGLARAWPRQEVRREFGRPDTAVTIRVGDLFEQTDAHLVVGFSDTFDTDTTNDLVISKTSLQAQLVDRLYNGQVGRIDAELTAALRSAVPDSTERKTVKRAGKLRRYPIGTVATLGTPTRRIFAVAYSRMGNDLVAESSVDRLWRSLGSLWDAVYEYGQLRRVAVPLVGSELARIDNLDRESLLKMMLLSFIARSRERVISRELIVVIHPRDHDKINMLEVEAFLRTL